MTTLHRIFVDFNNGDPEGRIRLNTNQTFKDIDNMNITLVHGMQVILYDYDGLETAGIMEFSGSEKIWVARIDWDKLMAQ
jgi:hypothetical protein